MIEERVFIAGGGPVGLVAAANLVRRGVPVTVFEAAPGLSEESRASTFHPPTLDMLAELGAAADLVAEGLVAPQIQYRSKRDGVIATFDFAAIADLTRHPHRLQCEQFRLTRILLGRLENEANFRIEFGQRVFGAAQDASSITVRLANPGGATERRARWLIGADGARSEVRRALAIPFQGLTWPAPFLVVSTPFDFAAVSENLAAVSYVADPQRWHFLLRIPAMWRVMFPIAPDVSDEAATSRDYAQGALATVVPGISHYE